MISKIPRKRVGDGYEVTKTCKYYSRRYNRCITIDGIDGLSKIGFYSDGATGARDIDSDGWIVHDHICRYAKWNDGTLIDNWTASTVLGDILWDESNRMEGWKKHWRKAQSIYWWWATYLIGGGAARKNGMRRSKITQGEIL